VEGADLGFNTRRSVLDGGALAAGAAAGFRVGRVRFDAAGESDLVAGAIHGYELGFSYAFDRKSKGRFCLGAGFELSYERASSGQRNLLIGPRLGAYFAPINWLTLWSEVVPNLYAFASRNDAQDHAYSTIGVGLEAQLFSRWYLRLRVLHELGADPAGFAGFSPAAGIGVRL
jgi:hypothetical protein